MPKALSYNQQIIEEFRANAGRVGGPFEGGDLLLLTTTGARSGVEHTTPLGYVRADGLLLVIASYLGAHSHPAWYHNLLAHPSVRVELGTDTFEAIAVPSEGARRDQLFRRVVDADPGYGAYQEGTARVLPVVVLEQPTYDTGEAAPREVTNLAEKLLEVHTWLRGQLRHVRGEAVAHLAARAAAVGDATGSAAAVGADGPVGEAPPPGLGFQIRQHCLAFCDALTFHHTSEDGHLFPALEQHHAHLRPVLERFHEEHAVIGRVKEELLALLGDITTADPERFRTELDRMTKELTAHLDYEEEHLLPVLAEIPFPPGPPTGG